MQRNKTNNILEGLERKKIDELGFTDRVELIPSLMKELETKIERVLGLELSRDAIEIKKSKNDVITYKIDFMLDKVKNLPKKLNDKLRIGGISFSEYEFKNSFRNKKYKFSKRTQFVDDTIKDIKKYIEKHK